MKNLNEIVLQVIKTDEISNDEKNSDIKKNFLYRFIAERKMWLLKKDTEVGFKRVRKYKWRHLWMNS